MAEFCESCPLRGACTGEITGIVRVPIDYTAKAVLRYGAARDAHIGQVGVLINSERQTSVPIRLPNINPDEILDHITKRIDECPGPMAETRGIFKKRTYAGSCSALGELSIRNTNVRTAIQNQIDDLLA